MNPEEALELSLKGTAKRTSIEGDVYKLSTIRYKDGSGYCLASKNEKVDFFHSKPGTNRHVGFLID